MSRLLVRPRLILLAAVSFAAVSPAAAHAALPGLQLGFYDDESLIGPDAAANAINLDHAKAAGATVTRFFLRWDWVAPVKPADLATAADPAWSGYSWRKVDAQIRAIDAKGMRALPVPFVAPAWAEGSGRPAVSAEAPAGTWKPSAAWYGAFATALARRYSGSYPDPERNGATLPAVRAWEAWNEPNLTTYLTPQWRRAGSSFAPQSPETYRSLLNAFYKSVKKVNPANFVLSAGTAPFGDQRDGDRRMMPARFWRSLVSVTGRVRPKARRGGKIVWFDAIAHHPYPIGPPRRRARNLDDVVVPDLGKITRPVAVAQRAGIVRPNRPKELWVTEISWDSRPDPDGLSLADQATYLQGALYVLWRQGVDVVTWYLVRDQAPKPSFATTYQSGLFFRADAPADDQAKPSFRAFRFPLTAYRSSGVANIWGKVPPTIGPATVSVEALVGKTWRTAKVLRAGSNGIFAGRLRVGGGTVLRARAGGEMSGTWRVF